MPHHCIGVVFGGDQATIVEIKRPHDFANVGRERDRKG
jgi:hypothetical protein